MVSAYNKRGSGYEKTNENKGGAIQRPFSSVRSKKRPQTSNPLTILSHTAKNKFLATGMQNIIFNKNSPNRRIEFQRRIRRIVLNNENIAS